MTGGRSTHGSGKKWEEKDVQGLSVLIRSDASSFMENYLGLVRLRDNLLAQLQELNRSKSRSKADDNIISEITRLESAITVTKDDLVSHFTLHRLWIDGSRDPRVLLNFATMVQRMN